MVLSQTDVAKLQITFQELLANVILNDETLKRYNLQYDQKKNTSIFWLIMNEFLNINKKTIGSKSVNSEVVPFGNYYVLKWTSQIDNKWKQIQFFNARACERFILNLLNNHLHVAYRPFFNVFNTGYCTDDEQKNGFVLEPRLYGDDLRNWVMNHVTDKTFEQELVMILITIVDVIYWMYNCNINHNDLHDRNIFIKAVYQQPVEHEMYGHRFKLKYVPVIIDFDWTTVGVDSNQRFREQLVNMLSDIKERQEYITVVRQHKCKLGKSVLPLFEEWKGKAKAPTPATSIPVEDFQKFEEENCDFFPQHASFSYHLSDNKSSLGSEHIDLARFMLYLIKLLRVAAKKDVLEKNDFKEIQNLYKACFERNFNVIECHTFIKDKITNYNNPYQPMDVNAASQQSCMSLSQPVNASQLSCMSFSQPMDASQQSYGYEGHTLTSSQTSYGGRQKRNLSKTKKSSSKSC